MNPGLHNPFNGSRFHAIGAPFSLLQPAPPTVPADRLLSLAEAAAVVPLSVKTLYRVAQRGEGPFHKVEGRWVVYEGELHEWVRSHRGQRPATSPRPGRPRRRGATSMRGRVLEGAR